jgi:hypothetical protein
MTARNSLAPMPRAKNSPLTVIAGLDPAIHPLRKAPAKMMDTRAFASPKGLRPRRRVKPAYDAVFVLMP